MKWHYFSSRICIGLIYLFITIFAQAETSDDEVEALFQEGYALYQRYNGPKAFGKFKAAAQLGHVEAAYYAGNILRRNDTYITEEAEQFYRQAAEGGDVYAMLRLAQKGNFCGTLRNCDYDREEWLDRAINSALPRAKAGDTEAMMALSSAYAIKGDRAADVEWVERAAENGHAFAQYWMAVMLDEQDRGLYWTDSGRSADTLKWLKASAEQGLPKAMLKLALEYKEDGRFDEANEWVDLLGQTDYFEALFNYGLILLQGPEGMFQYPEARPIEGLAVLFALYRETGNPSVKYSIDRHSNDLDSDRVTKARSRSEELLVDTPILHYLPKFGI